MIKYYTSVLDRKTLTVLVDEYTTSIEYWQGSKVSTELVADRVEHKANTERVYVDNKVYVYTYRTS